MGQRVFIEVVGFSDVERHALNTVFRLSEERQTCYSLWEPGAPEAPRLLLVDGLSYEGRLQLRQDKGLKCVWIGESPPEGCWRVFDRPIAWPEVVQAFDELFTPPPELDFDLDFGDTQPPAPSPPAPPPRRALIASADRDERLYLRAKLALAELTQADEAENAAQLMELLRAGPYQLALIDLALPGSEGWALLKQMGQAQPRLPQLILTMAQPSWVDGLRARLAGVRGLFGKPPDPARLQQLLQEL